MKEVINLDTYRICGAIKERVVVVDSAYLNSRVKRYCPICERVTNQDPKQYSYKCCSCDIFNKDTDLGVVVKLGQWTKI